MSDECFTKFPNAVLEAILLSDLTTLEYTAILYVARKTYGWGKTSDSISISKMASDTGHDLRGMQRTVKNLQERKILIVTAQGPRKMNLIQINDPAQWNRYPGKKSDSSNKHTVTQPYTDAQPYTVTRPGVYGQATVRTCGQATVRTYGHTTTHKRNKTNKETITKESAPPAPEGANVAADAADTANANTDGNSWTIEPLPDDFFDDEEAWT